MPEISVRAAVSGLSRCSHEVDADNPRLGRHTRSSPTLLNLLRSDFVRTTFFFLAPSFIHVFLVSTFSNFNPARWEEHGNDGHCSSRCQQIVPRQAERSWVGVVNRTSFARDSSLTLSPETPSHHMLGELMTCSRDFR